MYAPSTFISEAGFKCVLGLLNIPIETWPDKDNLFQTLVICAGKLTRSLLFVIYLFIEC